MTTKPVRRALRWALYLLAMLAVAGCGPAPRTVTEIDRGSRVRLRVGQTLEVRLAANPTTGYTWDLAAVDRTVLQPVDEPRFERGRKQALGSSGTMIWTFQAQTPGATVLRLEYRRLWEIQEPPADTFEITVQVDE